MLHDVAWCCMMLHDVACDYVFWCICQFLLCTEHLCQPGSWERWQDWSATRSLARSQRIRRWTLQVPPRRSQRSYPKRSVWSKSWSSSSMATCELFSKIWSLRRTKPILGCKWAMQTGAYTEPDFIFSLCQVKLTYWHLRQTTQQAQQLQQQPLVKSVNYLFIITVTFISGGLYEWDPRHTISESGSRVSKWSFRCPGYSPSRCKLWQTQHDLTVLLHCDSLGTVYVSCFAQCSIVRQSKLPFDTDLTLREWCFAHSVLIFLVQFHACKR